MASLVASGNPGIGVKLIDLTVAGSSGSSDFIDIPANLPAQVGFGVEVVSGSPTFTVQHRFRSKITFSPVYNHPFVAAQTSNIDGNYFFPVSQIRITSTTGRVRLFLAIPGIISDTIVNNV